MALGLTRYLEPACFLPEKPLFCGPLFLCHRNTQGHNPKCHLQVAAYSISKFWISWKKTYQMAVDSWKCVKIKQAFCIPQKWLSGLAVDVQHRPPLILESQATLLSYELQTWILSRCVVSANIVGSMHLPETSSWSSLTAKLPISCHWSEQSLLDVCRIIFVPPCIQDVSTVSFWEFLGLIQGVGHLEQ